jgi:Nucleoside 2-deoxyribosyltransferase like
MIEVQAPNPNPDPSCFSIFLAGAIDMGAAFDWQREVINAFEGWPDLIILNPRRSDWDSSWVQSSSNPHFAAQVNWELDNIQQATHVLMVFTADCKAPISLLELGLTIASGAAVTICCPPEFYRYGNIDILCQRHGITLHHELSEAIEHLQEAMGEGDYNHRDFDYESVIRSATAQQ